MNQSSEKNSEWAQKDIMAGLFENWE